MKYLRTWAIALLVACGIGLAAQSLPVPSVVVVQAGSTTTPTVFQAGVTYSGTITDCVLDFGDGSSASCVGLGTVSHQYANPADYTATVRLSYLPQVAASTVVTVTGANEDYFESLLEHPAYWKGYSLMPEVGAPITSPHYANQLLRPNQGGYAQSNNQATPLGVTYTPGDDAAVMTIPADKVSLQNLLFLPMGTSDGHSYFVTLDVRFGPEWAYANTAIPTFKVFQFDNPRSVGGSGAVWIETKFFFQSPNPPAGTLAIAGMRSYMPSLPHGVTWHNPVTPQIGDFHPVADRWIRLYWQYDQVADADDRVQFWAADTETAPVLLVDAPWRNWVSPNSISRLWFEFNTSTNTIPPGRGPLLAHVRNVVMLLDPGDVPSLLVQP